MAIIRGTSKNDNLHGTNGRDTIKGPITLGDRPVVLGLGATNAQRQLGRLGRAPL
jgi:hypothetical protein